jgi:hypothetical protein
MMPEPPVASSGQAAIVHLNNRRIAYYWSVYRIGQRDCVAQPDLTRKPITLPAISL